MSDSGTTRGSGLLRIEPGEWIHYPCECGHARSAHEGHDHQGAAPTHCSQGCGCKAFRAKVRKEPRNISALVATLRDVKIWLELNGRTGSVIYPKVCGVLEGS